MIAPHDHFVALPSRRALSPNGRSDYSVRICAPNGRCAFAPVWDVGPWNTKDDYWNAEARTVGRPQAGHAGGTGRVPQRLQRRQGRVRPQGGQPGGHRPRRRHLLGRPGPDQQHTVTVDYLWTGTTRLTKVVDDGPVYASPASDADVVGGGSGTTRGVPVECATDGWVRIGGRPVPPGGGGVRRRRRRALHVGHGAGAGFAAAG